MKTKELRLEGLEALDVLKLIKAKLGGDILTLVEFIDLKCHETEDWSGPDEPYLNFHVSKVLASLSDTANGYLRHAVDRTGIGQLILNPPSLADKVVLPPMNDGNPHPVNRVYPIAEGVGMRVDLFDDDAGPLGGMDSDDLLGIAKIELTPLSEDRVLEDVMDFAHDGEVYFSRDGAYYTLSYKLHRFKLVAVPKTDVDPIDDTTKAAEKVVEDAAKKAQELIDKFGG